MNKKRQVSFLLVLLLTCLLLVPGLCLAEEAELVLKPGDSIQEAIDSANPGAKILLSPGEYKEDILINKSLTLTGQDGAILNGNMAYSTILVEASGVTISNLEIKNASAWDIMVSAGVNNEYSQTDRFSFKVNNCKLTSYFDNASACGIAFSGDFKYADIEISDNIIKDYHYHISFGKVEANVYDSNIIIKNNRLECHELAGDNLVRPLDLIFADSDNLNIQLENNTIIADAPNSSSLKDTRAIDLANLKNSQVSISKNSMENISQGVHLSGDKAEFSFTKNTMTFSKDLASQDDYAFYVGALPNSSLLFENNEISHYHYGLYFDSSGTESDLLFNDNSIEAKVPVYVKGISGEKGSASANSRIIISNNRLAAETSAFLLGNINDSSSSSISLSVKSNNIASQKDAIIFDRAFELTNSNSFISFTANSISANNTLIGLNEANRETVLEALTFRYNYLKLADKGKIENKSVYALDILLNWWGQDQGADPDRIVGSCLYEYHLQSLDLEAEALGSQVNALARIRDNSNNIITNTNLTVRFTVNGANSLVKDLTLAEGEASLQYDSEANGNDTIKAELIFAGEVQDMNNDLTLTVKKKEEPQEAKDPSPTTGQQSDDKNTSSGQGLDNKVLLFIIAGAVALIVIVVLLVLLTRKKPQSGKADRTQ